ncbi:MAG: protease [Gorillibacterium sp.]|nr:protease [Gorillibacterium sp.]
MLHFYLGCLVLGGLFAVVSVLLGDVLSTALDGILDFLSADYMNPTVIASIVTVLGGTGILFTLYTEIGWAFILILALLIGLVSGIGIHFLYVKPMMNGENSSGYSMNSLTGKIGEVLVPIPAVGYGEVLVRTGAYNTNQVAASFEHTDIQAGERVVIVEVNLDGTICVSRFENISKGD